MSTFLQVWIILGLLCTTSNANPVGISISGKIIEDSTGLALTGPVAFRVKLMSKDNCILYSEEFTTSLSTSGTFTFTLGKGANSVNAYYPTNPVTGQSVVGMNRLFSNLNPSAVTSLGNGAATGSPISSDNVACPGTYTPIADDFRKVRIEFDNGDSQGYRAILPYHQIRTVPYAMIAEEAADSEKLGGVAATDYAKLTDLPNLSTDVPAAETDPSVQAFAKSAVSGVSGNSCPAGYILTLDNNVLKCIVDGGSGGGSYTLPVASNSVLGGVMVPGTSDIAVDGSGNLTLKALATSKITGLDTALSNLAGGIKYTDMPGTSCGAGQALVWTSPANTFSCYSLTIAQSQVTNLTTDLAGKVSKAGDTMSGALNMGSQDVLATGHITMSNQKTITVGKYNQTQEDTLAGTLTGSNEGATWYNSAMKALRFWDGSARQTVVATTAACTDGQLLKWNDTTKVWYCAADAGASGGANATQIQSTDVAVTAPTTTGQVLRYNTVTSKWEPSMLQAADIPTGLARNKVAAGSANHVLINDGSGLVSSEAQLAVSRGGTGQSTYTDGQLLVGKSDGTLAKANITAGSGVTVTNGDGSITIAATATSNITDGSIVDADVNAAAAIARSKLANGTANRVVVNNASGVMSDAAAITASRALVSDANGIPTHSVTTSAELAYVNGVTSSIQTQLDNLTTSAGAKVAKTGDTMTGNLVMNAQNEVRFADADSSNYVGFKSPATVGTNVTYTLPAADGSANQVLQTNGSGTLSWATAASGSDTLGGLSCSSGDVASWNGSAWVCQGAGNANVASTIVKRSPSGAIAAGIADFTGVRVFDGVSGYITLQTPATVTSYALTLPTGTGTNGQMLTTNGSGVLSWTSPSASLPGLAAAKMWVGNVGGTATAVSMSGDATMDNAGAVTIGASKIGSNHILDSSIDNVDINPGANIDRSKIASGVAYGMVVNNSSGVMQNGLACATVGHVPTWTATGFTCQAPSMSVAALTSGNIWVGNGSNVAASVTMSGDVTIDNAGATSIGTGKVTSTHIANGTIADTDISSSAAITRSKIASGTNYGIVANNSSGVMGAGIACSTNGHVLAWTATGFACTAPSSSLPTLASANIWVGNGSSAATAVAASGDVTLSNAGAFAVTKIQGRNVSSTTPTAGQVLMYISSTWTPTSPTTSGAVSSLLSLDASGIATALGVDIKGATTGTVGLRAPNSFTNYNLTMPADDGDANQVLTTNGSGTLTWTTPGGAPTITAKTADFTVATGEDNYFYMITNTTTANLPAVASVPAGFRATFKRMGGANVNILANGSETIDGATQRSLTSVYQTISVMNTGSEWAVIGGGATGTLGGCVPGSQSYPGAGTYTLTVDADRASKCKFTITVQGAGGGTGSSGGTGGRGGALSAVYTAPGAGTFEIHVGSPGLSGGNGGSGGGGAGGNGSSGKGGGGGGASAVRWTTTAPTDVLLAIAGGGGGGASTGLNGGGNGGGVIAATNGQTSAATEGGKAGVNNVGGAGGTGSGNGGGAGGSSVGAGSSGVGGTPVAPGGAAVTAFSISGGGGGGVATLQACGGGGGGYGGGGGGAVGSSIYGGGGGGGGYVNSSALDSFTSVTGPAAGVSGSVLIEWN